MARPANTEQRRAEIAAALARVMATTGYERATIALIAREAGLAPGLLHYHYARKEEILLALVDGLAATAAARIQGRLAGAVGPAARLDAVLDALLDRGEGADQQAVACWALIGAEAVKDADVRRHYERHLGALHHLLTGLLAAACHDQGRSAEGCPALAGALIAQVEGFFSLSAAVPALIPAGSAAGLARRTASGLIEAQPPRHKGEP